jgi:SAM-dependent methyltransferase
MDRPRGTGPGEITEDGCAVDFYALLPSFGEPEIVHAAIGEGTSILELGCGTGRILRPLAGLGHPVQGVDESAAMLAHIPDLPTVCSRIETLRLDRTFGAVLLASTMINSNPQQRRAFLATCRRHLDGDGVAVFQQNPPIWFEDFEQIPRVREDPGGIRRIIRSAHRVPPRMHVEVEYQVGDRVWTHAWGSYEIGEEELRTDLSSADLRFGRWLTDDQSWFTARPAS